MVMSNSLEGLLHVLRNIIGFHTAFLAHRRRAQAVVLRLARSQNKAFSTNAWAHFMRQDSQKVRRSCRKADVEHCLKGLDEAGVLSAKRLVNFNSDSSPVVARGQDQVLC